MEDQFSLLISLCPPGGFEVFGEFGIGYDRKAASALFDSLWGDEKLSDGALLHIDLIAKEGLLPAEIRSKCGRLEELGRKLQADHARGLSSKKS